MSIGAWLTMGAGTGTAFGVVIMAITSNPAAIGIGCAVGMALGIAIGSALSKTETSDTKEE